MSKIIDLCEDFFSGSGDTEIIHPRTTTDAITHDGSPLKDSLIHLLGNYMFGGFLNEFDRKFILTHPTYYIATTGSYENFDNLIVLGNEIAFVMFKNDMWTYKKITFSMLNNVTTDYSEANINIQEATYIEGAYNVSPMAGDNILNIINIPNVPEGQTPTKNPKIRLSFDDLSANYNIKIIYGNGSFPYATQATTLLGGTVEGPKALSLAQESLTLYNNGEPLNVVNSTDQGEKRFLVSKQGNFVYVSEILD